MEEITDFSDKDFKSSKRRKYSSEGENSYISESYSECERESDSYEKESEENISSDGECSSEEDSDKEGCREKGYKEKCGAECSHEGHCEDDKGKGEGHCEDDKGKGEGYCEDDKGKEDKEKSVAKEEFERCGKDCLGEDCECCHDSEDDDEDEDPVETDMNIDTKECWCCKKRQHIRNFISLINGTETKTCLTCRDVNNNKVSPLKESYRQLKRNMPPCTDCGDDNPDHLEFNHINPPTKRGQVCSMTTIATQLEESEGCDSKCKKCHIVHTAFQRPPKRPWADLRRQERSRIAREFVNNYKMLLCGCQNPNCKDKFDKNVLAFYEFHHKDFRNKLFNISKMLNGGFSIEAIMKELEKCILLCAYCHKIETMAEWAKRREYYTSLDRPLIKRKKKENTIKLTFDDASEIRKSYNEQNVTMKQLAEKFNVAYSTIWNVVNNILHKNETYERLKDREPKLTREQITDMTQLYGTETVTFVSQDGQKEFEINKYELLKMRESYNIKNISLSKLANDYYNVSIVYMYEVINNKRHIDNKYVKTRNPYQFSAGDILDIRRLYNEGNLSFSELAEKYDSTDKYISFLITNNQRVDDTDFITRWDKTFKKLDDKNVTDIRDLYCKKNVDVRNLAIRYSIPIEHVQEIIETMDRDTPIDEYNITNLPIAFGDAEVEEIRNLYNNGNSSISDLAEKYGLTILHVKEIIANTKYVNKNYVRKKFPRKFTNNDVRERRHLYNSEKYSFAELAKIYNTVVTYVADIIANKLWGDNDYVRTNFHVQLTDDDAFEIRKVSNHVSIQKLAETYNISTTNIKSIINNADSVDKDCVEKKYVVPNQSPKGVIQKWEKKIVICK